MRRFARGWGVALVLFAGSAAAQETPQTGAPADWPMSMLEPQVSTFVQADRLEGQTGHDDSAFVVESQGWIGTDSSKFWWKLDGEAPFGDGADDQAWEGQALYSRMVSPFFDLQLGVRQEVTADASRTHAVIGVQGLAPYWFELDAALFVSHTGKVTARLEAEYELLFSQRLILQPRTELNVAFQDVEALGIGSGLSSAEVGLRLRYEIRREVAPYVGVAWRRAVGGTAHVIRADGHDPASTALVAGVRLWY